MITGFADFLSAVVDHAISGSVAAARQNSPGAADEKGVTMQQWSEHYAEQMRSLAKTVDGRIGACRKMEKALHRSSPHGSTPAFDALAKGGDDALAKMGADLAKAWADTRALQSALVAERPAYEALAKRIEEYLAEPAARPGSPSYGTPRHLVGRAIH